MRKKEERARPISKLSPQAMAEYNETLYRSVKSPKILNKKDVIMRTGETETFVSMILRKHGKKLGGQWVMSEDKLDGLILSGAIYVRGGKTR